MFIIMSLLQRVTKFGAPVPEYISTRREDQPYPGVVPNDWMAEL